MPPVTYIITASVVPQKSANVCALTVNTHSHTQNAMQGRHLKTLAIHTVNALYCIGLMSHAAIMNADFSVMKISVVGDIQLAETWRQKTLVHALIARGYFGSVEPHKEVKKDWVCFSLHFKLTDLEISILCTKEIWQKAAQSLGTKSDIA